jgi:nucleosome binding factor SPN SPT16 subunit
MKLEARSVEYHDLVHFERIAFKKTKVFDVPFFQKGDKKSVTTQNTKDSESLAKSLQHLAMNWRIMHTTQIPVMYI